MKRLGALAVVLILSGCQVSPQMLAALQFWNRPTESPVACQQWVGATRAAGFLEDEIPNMHFIMHRESNCQPGVVSTTDDWGLYQIHASWVRQLEAAGIVRSVSDLLNPGTNARAARYVFTHQGLSAWRK